MRKSWQYLAMATVICGVAITTVQAFQSDATNQRITRSFRDEKLSDVLAWLSLGKYSFVCAEKCYHGDHINLDLQGATIDEAMEAIAMQTNGKWVQKGDIFTLYPNTVNFNQPQTLTFTGIAGQPSLTPDGNVIEAPTVCPLGGVIFQADVKNENQNSNTNTFVVSQANFAGFQRNENGNQDSNAVFRILPRDVNWSLDHALTFAWQQQDPFEYDMFGTSPMREYQFKSDQVSSETEKQIQSTVDRLNKVIQQISKQAQDGKLTNAQSAELHKQLAEIQVQLRQLLAKQNKMQWDNGAFKFEFKDMPGMEKMKDGFKFFPKDMKGFKLDEKQRLEIENAMKDAEKARGQAFMKLNSDQMKKLMEEGMKFKDFKMDPKAQEEMRKAMEEAMKANKDNFMKFKDFKMDAKTQEEMRKAMEEAMKTNKDTFMKFKDFQVDPKVKVEIEKAMKDAEKARGEAFTKLNSDQMKKLMDERGAMVLNGQKIDFDKIAKSLTDKQKEIMKKKGYLSPEDLTSDQRKMLGKLPEGNFTISYSKDGQSFTIKSGK